MNTSKFKILYAAVLFSSFALPFAINAQQAPTDAKLGAIVLAATHIDIDYAKQA